VTVAFLEDGRRLEESQVEAFLAETARENLVAAGLALKLEAFREASSAAFLAGASEA
jgi:hypothetical protein